MKRPLGSPVPGRAALALAAALCLAAVRSYAADTPQTKPAPPATHKVVRAPLRLEVKLSGVFEARRMAEVSLSPEAWAQLRVAQVVEHGAPVKKGDVLLRLDLEKIDKAIGEKQAAWRLGELSLKQAEEELRHLEAATPEQLASAARAQKRAAEDLDYFTKVGRPLAKKEADNSLKNRADVLEYVKEELRQLEKMYKADDLTEETEQIVLKRQRDAVGRAEFALEKEKLAHEQQLQVALPRQAEDIQAARQAADEGKKTKDVLLPLALRKKRLEAAKAKTDHAQATADLASLKKDREAMTVKAPIDGVVYYGRCAGGKWATAATVEPKLVPGGTLTADVVLMTVVDPGELLVRASVPEKELHHLRKGLSGAAVPTGYPERKLQVKLETFSTVPMPSGQFDVALSVAGKPGPVMPGMTCSVALLAYEKKGVIAVPASAVFGEPDKPDERFVYLKTPGRSQKRVVKVGRTHGDRTEILEGLQEGEVVLLERPD